MGMRIGERVKCPFFINVASGKNVKGVICESLAVNLGFQVTHYTRLPNNSELDDYMDIFCCDMWETCPYAKAVKIVKYGEK